MGKAAGKVEILLMNLMLTDVRKSDLSTKMSISRKVTWEGKMIQVNRTG